MPSKENRNIFGRTRSGGLSGGVDKIKERLGRNPTPANNNSNNNNSGRRPLPSPSPPPPPPLTNRQREQLLQKSGNNNNNKIPPTGESSARQSSQRKQQKQPANNTNNNKEDKEIDTMTLQKLSSIENVYGSNANIYTDVLKVKQNATSSEIREAFFCLRYDVYQKLEGSSNTTNDNTANALTSDERKEVEAKMDAITSAYHILSDVNRRKVYDASLLQQKRSVESPMDVDDKEDENEYDDNGIISSTRGGMNSNRKSSSSSNKKKTASPESNHLPIGQRRSVLRRNRAGTGSRASGMNVGRQVRAETVGGALNTRAAPSAETQDSSVFSSGDIQGNTTGRVSPWDADFSNANLPAAHQVNTSLDTQAAALGVSKPMTAREEMLYKSKLHFDSQKNKFNTNDDGGGERLPKGRIGSVRYGNKGGPGQLISPTGVDGFDSSGNNNKLRRPSPTTTTESQSIVSKDEDDDTRASSMYDDDGTYDTETYADDTTYGETIDDTTIGDSTWASYDDESYITNDHESEGGKFSPGHKKGTKPEPILKSGLNKNGSKVKRSNSDSRRVTIHSHRGKGEVNDEDFSLFEGACPNMPNVPSLQGITEEAIGTYHDFTHALHQVSTSFVLSPDDIDKMADKIRDAKIELGENYYKQVKERNQLIDNGGRERRSSKSQGKGRSNERSSSKRQVKKTLSA